MDLAPVFAAMLKPLMWLLPLLVISGIVKSPWFKGWLGERKVRRLIQHRLDPKVYREFSNFTVRDEFGYTTQIDHVYVSPYGVFVIETKHMGHWIFGSKHQPLWTQQIFRTKIRFQNPLRQNYRHIKTLQSLLQLPEKAFKSVIVFTGGSSFKTAMPAEVCTCTNLIDHIRSIDTIALSDEQVESTCQSLQRLRLGPSLRTHLDHLGSLRKRRATAASATTASNQDSG